MFRKLKLLFVVERMLNKYTEIGIQYSVKYNFSREFFMVSYIYIFLRVLYSSRNVNQILHRTQLSIEVVQAF